MLNISDVTAITGLDLVSSKKKLVRLLHDPACHSKPVFTYYGRVVSRGYVDIRANGVFVRVHFTERHGWAQRIHIEKLPRVNKPVDAWSLAWIEWAAKLGGAANEN